MTYKKLYEDALFKLDHNRITLGEFKEMTKPLDREVEQQPILDKIRAEIIEMRSKRNCSCSDCLDIIDKYKADRSEEDGNDD